MYQCTRECCLKYTVASLGSILVAQTRGDVDFNCRTLLLGIKQENTPHTPEKQQQHSQLKANNNTTAQSQSSLACSNPQMGPVCHTGPTGAVSATPHKKVTQQHVSKSMKRYHNNLLKRPHHIKNNTLASAWSNSLTSHNKQLYLLQLFFIF